VTQLRNGIAGACERIEIDGVSNERGVDVRKTTDLAVIGAALGAWTRGICTKRGPRVVTIDAYGRRECTGTFGAGRREDNSDGVRSG